MAELIPCGASLDQMSNSRGRALPPERERESMEEQCPVAAQKTSFFKFKNCVHQDKRLPLKIMATVKPLVFFALAIYLVTKLTLGVYKF